MRIAVCFVAARLVLADAGPTLLEAPASAPKRSTPVLSASKGFVLAAGNRGAVASRRQLGQPGRGRRKSGAGWLGGTSTQPSGLVWIPPGEFTMGSPTNEFSRSTDEAQWHVRFSRGFWICDHEVTWAEYNTLMEGSIWQPDDTRLPVTSVSWLDAKAYCEKLTEVELSAGRLQAGQVYRLPTEAEWEFAARAGNAGPRYGELDAIAWWIGNSGGEPRLPKGKKMNGHRLFDMIGNVSEWCFDIYGAYPSAPGTDPTGARRGNTRVVRGGSHLDGEESNRLASRDKAIPEVGLPTVGFRIVLGVDLPP